MTEWINWSGIESARPSSVEDPADTAAIVASIERARSAGPMYSAVGG